VNKLKNKSLLIVGEAGTLSDDRVVTSRVWFMNSTIFCCADKGKIDAKKAIRKSCTVSTNPEKHK
jgi:hypothetical protein